MSHLFLVIFMLGLFAFLYIALDAAYDQVYDYADTYVTDTDSVHTLTILNTLWTWLPVAALLSIIVYLISKVSRENAAWP